MVCQIAQSGSRTLRHPRLASRVLGDRVRLDWPAMDPTTGAPGSDRKCHPVFGARDSFCQNRGGLGGSGLPNPLQGCGNRRTLSHSVELSRTLVPRWAPVGPFKPKSRDFDREYHVAPLLEVTFLIRTSDCLSTLCRGRNRGWRDQARVTPPRTDGAARGSPPQAPGPGWEVSTRFLRKRRAWPRHRRVFFLT
jgi:hypothetical protein